MGRLPLEGIRALDVGAAWAIPIPLGLLAGMGAEVIKVESAARPDMTRYGGYPRSDPGEQFWNRSGRYHHINRNKLGVTLDLGKPSGARLFKDLVRVSDLVAENFTPRVMPNLGLDYKALKAVRPDIIMVSASGFGASGPWVNYSAYGLNLEPTTGLTHLTGYRDGPPEKSPVPYTDLPSVFHAGFAILAALEYRRRTGKGQWIDLSEYEVGVCSVGEAVMDYTMNGRVQTRQGNRHPAMAPHGCYPCRGENEWVAVAVTSDEEWQRFCRALGDPPWTQREEFATVLGRLRHQDEMDQLISAWTGSRDHREVMNLLQGAGVRAGAVLNTREVLLDPHVAAWGGLERVEHPREFRVGSRPHLAMPWKMSGADLRLDRPAPGLGAHNRRVLGEVLGLSDRELADLEAEGVVGKEPRQKVSTMAVMPPPVLVEKGAAESYDPDFEEKLGITY